MVKRKIDKTLFYSRYRAVANFNPFWVRIINGISKPDQIIETNDRNIKRINTSIKLKCLNGLTQFKL